MKERFAQPFILVLFIAVTGLLLVGPAFAGNFELTVVDQEDLGVYPMVSVYNPVNDNLYIGNYESLIISVYSVERQRILQNEAISVNVYPWKLFLSPDGAKLYSTDSNASTGTEVIDLQAGSVVATLQEAFQTLYADTQTQYMYGAIVGSSEIQRLDTSTDTVTSTGITLKNSYMFQIDSQKRRLYNVSGYYNDAIDVYDLDTLQLQTSYNVGMNGGSGRLKLNPRANRLYVASASPGNWNIFDTETGADLGNLTTSALVSHWCGNRNMDNLKALILTPKGCGSTPELDLFDQFSGELLATVTLPDGWCVQTYAVSKHTSLNKFFVVADSTVSGPNGKLYVIDMTYQE